jgi:hypothetical protein
LRDAGDKRIALRPMEERWELTFQALLWLFRRADPTGAEDHDLQRLLRAIVVRQEAEGVRRLLLEHCKSMGSSSPAIASLAASQAFDQLSYYISFNYPVFVDLDPKAAGSQLISYVVDQRFPDRPKDFDEAEMHYQPRRRIRKKLGLLPHRYYHPLTIGGAGSNHLEIKAPDGVDIGWRKLKLPGRKHPIEAAGTSARRARFLAPRTAKAGEGYARIDIVPGSGVMRRAGPVVLVFCAVLIALVATTDIKPTAGAALLLIVPSLASFIAARPNEHPYVTSVVLWVRILTLSPIALSAFATGVLLTEAPRWALSPFIVCAIGIAIILAIGQYRLRGQTQYLEVVHNDLARVA